MLVKMTIKSLILSSTAGVQMKRGSLAAVTLLTLERRSRVHGRGKFRTETRFWQTRTAGARAPRSAKPFAALETYSFIIPGARRLLRERPAEPGGFGLVGRGPLRVTLFA